MKGDGGTTEAKRRAGESAAETVESGMVVGLGTGSTAGFAIDELGRRIDDGLDVRGIPTSYQSRARARTAGIPLVTLEDAMPDVAIDGADRVLGFDLVKGGGAAHAREKFVAAAADRFVVVIDDSKRTDSLDVPVPVEVIPDAVPAVSKELERLGGRPDLRLADRKDGPVVTDNGNLVVDCEFDDVSDFEPLAGALSELAGVVEHGLFVGMADELHVGSDVGVEVFERSR